MAYRHPFGGSILLMLGACVVVPMLIVGCSSDDWDDDDDYYCDPSPRYHHMTVILKVADLAGDALGQVTVWVDGVPQVERTSWEFVSLGAGYPESWWGFKANWIKSGFTVATYAESDVAKVIVQVSKPGYYTEATTFNVEDSLPTEVYARDTFIMEPAPCPTTAEAQEPRMKEEPGEVIGWDKDTTTSRLPSMYKLASAGPPGVLHVPAKPS